MLHTSNVCCSTFVRIWQITMADHLQLADFLDLRGVDRVEGLLSAKGICPETYFMPFVGAFSDTSALATAAVFFLLNVPYEYVKTIPEGRICTTGPFPTDQDTTPAAGERPMMKEYLRSVFKPMDADLWIKAIELGVLVVVQAVPYAVMMEGDSSAQAHDIFKRFATSAQFINNTPPWHEKFCQLMEQRIEAEGPDGPIFILGSGKSSWQKRRFVEMAQAHKNWIVRPDHQQRILLSPGCYPDKPTQQKTLEQVKQLIAAKVAEREGQVQLPAREPAAAAAQLFPMNHLLQQLQQRRQQGLPFDVPLPPSAAGAAAGPAAAAPGLAAAPQPLAAAAAAAMSPAAAAAAARSGPFPSPAAAAAAAAGNGALRATITPPKDSSHLPAATPGVATAAEGAQVPSAAAAAAAARSGPCPSPAAAAAAAGNGALRNAAAVAAAAAAAAAAHGRGSRLGSSAQEHGALGTTVQPAGVASSRKRAEPTAAAAAAAAGAAMQEEKEEEAGGAAPRVRRARLGAAVAAPTAAAEGGQFKPLAPPATPGGEAAAAAAAAGRAAESQNGMQLQSNRKQQLRQQHAAQLADLDAQIAAAESAHKTAEEIHRKQQQKLQLEQQLALLQQDLEQLQQQQQVSLAAGMPPPQQQQQQQDNAVQGSVGEAQAARRHAAQCLKQLTALQRKRRALRTLQEQQLEGQQVQQGQHQLQVQHLKLQEKEEKLRQQVAELMLN